VFSGQTAPDQLGGPLRIAKYSGEFAAAGVSSLVLFIAVISVSVGLINLFPIPVLDGGHLLFYAIEAIQGRPLSNRVQEIGFRIGLALILALFVFVTWNDILFLLPGSPVGQASP
jgi:regulator of sigma E protease